MRAIVREHGLPLQLFQDLLDAFSQDVVKNRYADFAELLDYSRRSANPVGRLLLHLFRKHSPENCKFSDRICSALQLINFWQDVGIDYETKNRIYLPQDDMRRFGVGEDHLRQRLCDPAFRELMRFQVDRARQMMLEGKPLVQNLEGRFRLEIAITVQGGLRILEKLENAGYDMFRRRPTQQWFDWPLLFLRAPVSPDEYCQQKAAASGSSFYYSFLFLPPERRRAITALYAFCREVDDVVDECTDTQVAHAKLAWWRSEVGKLLRGQAAATRSRRALHALHWAIPDRRGTHSTKSSTAWRWISRRPATSISRVSSATATTSPARSACSLPASSATAIRARSSTRRISAPRSSSPTSSATSARTRARTASTCRWTS